MSGSGPKRTSPSALHICEVEYVVQITGLSPGACPHCGGVLEWKTSVNSLGRRQKSTFSCAAAATTFVRWKQNYPGPQLINVSFETRRVMSGTLHFKPWWWHRGVSCRPLITIRQGRLSQRIPFAQHYNIPISFTKVCHKVSQVSFKEQQPDFQCRFCGSRSIAPRTVAEGDELVADQQFWRR